MNFPDKNIVGKTKSSRITKTDDWEAAKNNDPEASNRIIDLLWSDKKTEQLKEIFSDPGKVIFVSQPSTSGDNALPIKLAEKLSNELKTDFIMGDMHTESRHQEQSKKISFAKRAFHPRKYEIIEVEALKNAIGDKQVCLVEDVITSGGSVAAFTKALNREGIEVNSIAALTGERRLNIDEKTYERLEQALKAKNINIDIQNLTKSLTRMEAGGIIMTANSSKSEAAIERLETNLNDRIHHEQNQEFAHQLKESENSNPVSAKEVPEQSQLKEKENPVEIETKQLGHDHTPEQMKPERDPNLTAITPKIEIDLEFPQANTSIADEWKKELEESQKLVDQEHSKEMPREQELHQEQIDQLKQQEQKFEKEPQFEMSR
jgi:hypoxanthine-guanine phosphoribosyltransferase